MAEAEERKEEYYIRLLTFVIGPATEVLQLYFEIKVLNSLDFFLFLENHKHVLFHELHPTIPCCECKTLLLAAPLKKSHLADTQFDILFETDKGKEVQDHKKEQGHQITQLCLCSVSAKKTTSVVLMDITLLSSVIKSCCQPWSISGNPSWIKDIKETRNFITHSSCSKITKSEFDQKFAIVEQSVLNIASVLGPVHLNMIKRQISNFKNSNISTIIDRDLTQNNNDSIHKILEKFVEEQKITLESFANQTRNLVENTKVIKNEVLNRLEEQRELTVGLRNVVFEVKTVWKDELSKATDHNKKGLSHDDDVCYVEWTLATPGNWDVDEIKETLEKFSSLMGNFFRIVFVYMGCLVIQTLAQVRFLQSDEFPLAVKSFLTDLLDICDLDTEIKTIVPVEITISKEKLESKNMLREKMSTSRVECDPCFSNNISSEAIQYCYECQTSFCLQCIKTHSSQEAFLKHHLARTGTLTFESSCSKHEGNMFAFFCVKHDCLCCKFCICEDHSFCRKFVPLEKAAEDVEHSVMFQDVSNVLFNITTTLDKAITSQNENIKNLDDDEVKIVYQVANHKVGIIERLNELEDKFIHDTKLLKEEKKAKSESCKNRLLQIGNPIKNMSMQIKQLSKHGLKTKIFILLHKYKLEILNYEIKLQDILPFLETNTLKFQPPSGSQNTVSSLGSTVLNSLKYKTDYRLSKTQEVQIPLFAPQMPTKFTLDCEISIKRNEGLWITGMCITHDYRLLLCDSISTEILVYSYTGVYLQRFELSGQPRDIVVIPGSDKAVVTLPRHISIQFIDIKKMTAGSTHTVPSICHGVTFINEKICVGGYGGYLHILDKEGKYVNTIKVPDAYDIYYLHPGPDNSVYYTDFTGKAVGCISLEGKHRFRYTSADLKGPQSVITDKNGNVYVACYNSNDIRRFTQNGEFLDVILNKANNINRPRGMVFSNDYRKLFVTNQFKGERYLLMFICS